MKLPRRQFLQVAAGALALPALTQIASANPYPDRPVHIVVGFPPGGAADIDARLLGPWLSERLGQPFIIDNRSGASGNIATEAVVRASPDGQTLLLVGLNNAINTALFANLNFNFIRDIVPIASIYRAPLVVAVNLSVPVRTLAEFIAYAKANPGKINMASTGIGSPQHVSGELFKLMAGIDMVHVPYRGSAPALTDLLSGQVQVMFETLAPAIGQIKAGKLRVLAVTSASRLEMFPEIPTVSETIRGYEAVQWQGMGAPKGTPAAIVERLNKEINSGLADPNIKARFADLGGEAFVGSPEDFEKFIVAEVKKWAEVVRFAGIKPA